MKLIQLSIRIALRLFKGGYLQTSLQVAGIHLPLWQYGPFVLIGGGVFTSIVLDHLHIPSCNWLFRDSFCSGMSAVVFGESKGMEDAFYTPLGFTILLSLVVGIAKFILGGRKLIYNEKRHLDQLKKERAAMAEERAAERAAVAAVLEWYEQHKAQLPGVPPPQGIAHNGHNNGAE